MAVTLLRGWRYVSMRGIRIAVMLVFLGDMSSLCQTGAALASSTSYTLSGIVLDDTDGHPVSGVIVIAEEVKAPQKDFAGAKTGADGRFSIATVPAPEYHIMVQKQGFLSLSRTFTPSAPAKDSGSADVGELRMVAQSAIAGKIIDVGGNPLSGAAVQLSRVELDGLTTTLSTVSVASTNDLGEYRIFGLQPGPYYVSAFYQDFAGLLGLRRRVARSTDKGSSEMVNEDFAVTYYPGTSDVEAANVVRLKPGMTASGIDIQVETAQSSTVRGVVANIPANTPTFTVRLSPSHPGRLGASRGYLLSSGNEFFFRSIPPGEYVLRADLQSEGRSLSARQEILVAGGAVDDVVLDLHPPFPLTGKVSLSGHTELPQDLKLSLNSVDRRTRIPISPDREGRFQIQGAAPDRYRLTITDAAAGVYVKSVALDTQALSPNAINIFDANHLLNIEVSDKAARLEGAALDGEEQPLRAGLAVLVALDSSDSGSQAVAIDHDGRFKFLSLAPGKYRISCFSDLTSPSDATWDVQKRVRMQGQEISVAEADRQNMRLHADEITSQTP